MAGDGSDGNDAGNSDCFDMCGGDDGCDGGGDGGACANETQTWGLK